jgi:2-dehydropantoate 2-reductase
MIGHSASGNSLRSVVFGAGAVGLAVTAQLCRAGRDVLVVTRREEAARRIGEDGIEVRDPATDSRSIVRPQVVSGLSNAEVRRDTPVLLGMRRSDLGAALAELAALAPDALAVTLQNDVDCEAQAARHFHRVIGVVVRQTATRTADNAVTTFSEGRMVVGPYPEGHSDASANLAGLLRGAGYDVGESRCISEDKWLKLAVNLMSAPNALVRRADHTTPEFVEIKVRLLEEARALFDACGVVARSCDGRDRSVDAEIAHQRASLERGTSARALPLYNQVWQALRRGGPLEADGYHRRILDLASEHSIPAPQNRRVLNAVLDAYQNDRGPESLAAGDLLVRG